MKNTNKNALYTILDNKFVNNLLFSLWSLRKNNDLSNIDILIFSKEEITQKNKNLITKICPNVIFKKSTKKLLNHDWVFDYDLKLEVFFIKDYNKVIYFDADVLFFKNFISIFNYECNFGAVNYGNFFSATIMLFSKKERKIKNFNKFKKIFMLKKYNNDQEVFNKMYLNYFKIPYNYNQVFTNFNEKTVKCLQFPGKIKGLNIDMETSILTKNSSLFKTNLLSYMVFKKIKKQFLEETKNYV